MKKIFAIILAICTISSMTVFAHAADDAQTANNNYDEIICFNDGSYLLTTVAVENTNDDIALTSTTYTKTGVKTISHYSSNDELLWQYKLTGKFSVKEGISVTCIDSSYSQTIYSSKWHFSDGNAYIENNAAHGQGTFKEKILFITTETKVIDATIYCDIYGNIS